MRPLNPKRKDGVLIMAIYHCSIKIGGRSKGQSAVAASAYRSGEKLTDNETGIVSDYTRKKGIVHSEISLCNNAPSEYEDREKLWNAVHRIEKQSNAQLWREIEVALPQEFNQAEQIKAAREYVKCLTEKGMCADWSIHDKGDENPHAHIMLTTRSIEENGEWALKSKKVYDLDENGKRIFQKTDKNGRKQYKNHKEDYNDWNQKECVEEWRKKWANVCNQYLSEEKKIDHRSFERQGKEQSPTIHEGYTARKIELNGETSDRCEINREIKTRNNLIKQIDGHLKTVEMELKELVEQKQKGNDRVEELLRRRASKSIGRITDGERAIDLTDIRATVADSRTAVATNDMQRANRIAYEESLQRKRNGIGEQETLEKNLGIQRFTR